MKQICTQSAPKAIGPYSQGVVVNDLLFTSGQIPLDPLTMTIIGSDVATQTIQVMKNLQAILETAGTSFDNVIKTTIYIKNMNDFSVINDVYATYFTTNLPARSCVEVARLPKDVLIEIEMIAKR